MAIDDGDDSALQRAEQALRESEARFSSALTAGRMGAWQTDLVTGTRHWTQEGMALFGLSLPGGLGQVGGDDDEYARAMHPDDRHLADHFHRLADAQDSFAAEYRIVRPDGSTLWLQGRGLVVARHADGRAHRLVSIMADATERRLADEALRVERERLALALTAAQMGAFDLDLKDGVLWWSPQMFTIFGVDPGHFVLSTDNVLSRIHPDDRELFLTRRAQSIADRRPYALDFRIVRPDGKVAWLGHRGHSDYDAEGRALRSFGVTTDITERKHVEELLREANREKDDFIATLAHELRNPLAPIRNAVHVLRTQRPAGAQAEWCGEVIERQVAQMTHLLDDLLDVSRLTRGHVQLRRRPLQLATAIEQAVEIAQPLVDAAGHRLTLTLPAEPLALQGDLTRLAQVFSNLLINAAKYTPPGGRITLAASRRGDEAVVAVTDTGIGIAAERMSHIFEMFGQVDSAIDRSQGGLGIGLSLARALIELHGGSISAQSEGPGKGSQFVVRLPLGDDAAVPAAGPVRAPGQAVPTPAGPLRVLIVDDLRDSADSLALLLRATGHEVEVAYGGMVALQTAETVRPDVVLLDLGMPELNGYEVCRRIRAQPWGAGVTIIAQTGWGQEEDRRRTTEAGFDHHLVKPIDFEALVAMFPGR